MSDEQETTERVEGALKVVPLRRPWRWVAAVVVLVLVAMAAHLAVTNERWQWSVVGSYLFSQPVLDGVLRTLELTALAEILGLATGVTLAVMRLSRNPILAWAARIYIWVFRSIPPLVLILVVYFLSALIPQLSIGIPFGPSFVSVETNQVVTQLVAAVTALGFAQAAYISEIVRGAILSISPGQSRAAMSLGMRPGQITRKIILPQAMRVAVPPLGNEVISMLKNTSLVSVIAYAELLTTVQQIYSRSYQQIPLLVVACLWYLALTTVATIGQSFLERHLGRSAASGGGRVR
ncbi:amino acid ABC transporter permease [Amycolatopsis pithecellobii]|uniref:amino acid ABC transporter permease n=1 Tax=Amycolatopsis pithecellobii TaxID=664692 RepID=UPI0028B0AB32|nr:amino acid ABC transporter permease [Amycolatopsis pithecellobii]